MPRAREFFTGQRVLEILVPAEYVQAVPPGGGGPGDGDGVVQHLAAGFFSGDSREYAFNGYGLFRERLELHVVVGLPVPGLVVREDPEGAGAAGAGVAGGTGDLVPGDLAQRVGA